MSSLLSDMVGQQQIPTSKGVLPILATLSKSSRTLPHIPPEVSRLLSSHLDLRSAARLMRTCRGLQDAGEMRLYRRLDMTGSLTPDVNPIYHPIDAASLRLRANIVDAKLERTLAALATHPYRIEYVNELRLEPSDGPPPNKRAKALFKLVGLVCGRIQRLDVLPFRIREDYYPAERSEFSCEQFYAALNIADFPYPRLTHLRVGFLGLPAAEIVPGWMSRMTELRSLHICAANGWHDHSSSYQWSPVPFDELHTLTIDNLYDLEGHYALGNLSDLLDFIPDIDTLCLRGQWRPKNRYDDTLAALENLSKLKTLIMCDEDYQRSGVIEGIEYHRIGKVDLAMEQGVFNMPNWMEQDEANIENIPIPHAPHLHRFTIITSSRPPLPDLAAIPVPRNAFPPKLLLPPFIHHMRRAPLLTTILYLYEPDFLPPAFVPDHPEPELFVDPERWDLEGHQGLIVRQYSNPDDEEEEFWHMRSLTRAAISASGETYVGARRSWWDYTYYKGVAVPREVLDQVYAEIGESPDFVQGGRSLMLGNGESTPWDVLREWRSVVDGPDEESWEGYDDDVLSDDE